MHKVLTFEFLYIILHKLKQYMTGCIYEYIK